MPDTLIDRRDGIVTLTFNRPEKKNALSSENWADLDRTIIEVSKNAEDRVLVLKGAGGVFSAGADISGGLRTEESKESKSGLTGAPPQAVIWEMRTTGELIGRLQRLPKPTIAVIDGAAMGVALGLALACDLIVASDRARFAAVFVKRGLALDGGTSWTLPRSIGLRRAKQMAYFGEVVTAQDALSWGMVNEVVAADDLDRVGTEWALRLARGPTTAISLIKKMLDNSSQVSFEQAVEDEARAQQIAFHSSDMQEGIKAFMEKREPRFTGT
jgi:2-(1,2-epoxy-1,2-dihydrophenyl)acetyl-CoA isomerase